MQQSADNLRLNFQNTSLDIFNLYKQSTRAVEASYHQGREDAFEEILKYVLSVAKGSLKYVPMAEFIDYLESRYRIHRYHCSKQNPTKIDTSHIDNLINQLADQGQRLAKQEGPSAEILQRLSHFEIFKMKESKKRKRTDEQIQQALSDQDQQINLIVQQRVLGQIKTRRTLEANEQHISSLNDPQSTPMQLIAKQFNFNLQLGEKPLNLNNN